MKNLKKLLSVLLCGLMAFSAVGCGGGPDDGKNDIPAEAANKTIIDIQIYDAGVNKDWLVDLSKEYAATLEGNSYEEGKTGVYYKIDGVSDTDINANSATHMYVAHGESGAENGRSLADEGLIIPITDVVTEPIDDRDGDGIKETSIKDKIDPTYYEVDLCANDGNCYALPSYGLKTGYTMDAYNFKYHGFYLAHPDTWNTDAARLVTNKYGSAWFVNPSNGADLADDAVLAVGNDGVAGTADDGMPTSMQEFVIMCGEMKGKGVTPFLCYKSSKRTETLDNIKASIDGFDAHQASFTYGQDLIDGKYVGEGVYIDIVTDVTSKAMFGTNYVFEPVVERVKVTRRTGHLASQTVGRYWAIAFLTMCEREGWYIDVGNQCSHLEGEERFVLNGAKIGGTTNPSVAMLIEGDYWYNESDKAGAMEKFKKYVTRLTGRELDLQWMYLPTITTGMVTGVGTASEIDGSPRSASYAWDMPITNSKEVDGVLYNEHVESMSKGATIYINKRYENQPKLIELCKGLMTYIHTDKALSYYTGNQGVYRAAMNYEVFEEDMQNLSDFERTTVAAFATCERRISPACDSMLYDFDYIMAKDANGNKKSYMPGFVNDTSIWANFYNGRTKQETFEKQYNADVAAGKY